MLLRSCCLFTCVPSTVGTAFFLLLNVNLVRGIVQRTAVSVHIQRVSQLRQKQPSFKTEALTLMLQAGSRFAQRLSSRRQEGRQLGLATHQFS